MIDMEIKKLMGQCDKAWKVIAQILDDDQILMGETALLMLTLNARYLNGIKKQTDPLMPEFRKQLKQEYIKLLDEKLDD